MSLLVRHAQPPRPVPRPGRTGSRVLLVVAVLALLGTGILDAVLRAGAAPAARTAASVGPGTAAALPSGPAGAERRLPSGIPGVRTAQLPGPAALQSLDGPAASPGSPLAQHLLAPLSSMTTESVPTAGVRSPADSRAPPHDAGTLASLPSRP